MSHAELAVEAMSITMSPAAGGNFGAQRDRLAEVVQEMRTRSGTVSLGDAAVQEASVFLFSKHAADEDEEN
jgi:hypothetical protein